MPLLCGKIEPDFEPDGSFSFRSDNIAGGILYFFSGLIVSICAYQMSYMDDIYFLWFDILMWIGSILIICFGARFAFTRAHLIAYPDLRRVEWRRTDFWRTCKGECSFDELSFRIYEQSQMPLELHLMHKDKKLICVMNSADIDKMKSYVEDLEKYFQVSGENRRSIH